MYNITKMVCTEKDFILFICAAFHSKFNRQLTVMVRKHPNIELQKLRRRMLTFMLWYPLTWNHAKTEALSLVYYVTGKFWLVWVLSSEKIADKKCHWVEAGKFGVKNTDHSRAFRKGIEFGGVRRIIHAITEKKAGVNETSWPIKERYFLTRNEQSAKWFNN